MNLTGQLLIAPPSIRGNFWEKSVIFITENHERGSLGVALNKSSKVSIREFSSQSGVECDIPGKVYAGGPVNLKAMTLLHSSDWSCENTMQINEDFCISSHQDILTKLAMGDRPTHWRLIVGLCAWTPGQLEAEVKGRPPYNHNQSWLIATANYESVFGLDGRDQWTNSIECSSMEFVQKILD